jgi:ligand-binding sensor protein
LAGILQDQNAVVVEGEGVGDVLATLVLWLCDQSQLSTMIVSDVWANGTEPAPIASAYLATEPP